jgi:hypothetical protein
MDNDIKTPPALLFREALKIQNGAIGALVVSNVACRMGISQARLRWSPR